MWHSHVVANKCTKTDKCLVSSALGHIITLHNEFDWNNTEGEAEVEVLGRGSGGSCISRGTSGNGPVIGSGGSGG